MTEYKDLEAMIEIVSLAITRQESEEAFFRRSACSSTPEKACSLFSEIADDIASCRKGLENRKEKLTTELNELTKSESHREKQWRKWPR